MRKRIALFVVIIILVNMIPVLALAASGTISTDGTYDISAYGNDSVITIEPGLTVTLTNTGGSTYTNLRIDCGAGVDLTLDGVKINNSATADACALAFTDSGNTLTFANNTSTLTSGENEPGIRVEGSTALIINVDILSYVNGGNFAAGIGGGIGSDGGSITIEDGSGWLEADGGGNGSIFGRGGGAGIGGGEGGNGGTVTINGGYVDADGGEEGAGIGGGDNGIGGSITINGGEVSAEGGNRGSGIGGGDNGSGGSIKISNGQVTAQSGNTGAGIGGGRGSDGGSIEITGGTVDATGDAAGIGGGDSVGGDGGIIKISGGTIVAKSSSYGAGIGGGSAGNAGSITIEDGHVTASSHDEGAGIGGGSGGDAGSIEIKGGTVIATGGPYGAGIGGGYDENGGSVTISGGHVTATSPEFGAGIGSGQSGDNVNVTISGGTVIAKCMDDGGAGIGSGETGVVGEITISGGTVTASSLDNGLGSYQGGAGIGGGYHSDGGTIKISGGDITATGWEFAAGIGGGKDGGGGSIEISGGIVDATGGDFGAGIGGGVNGDGGSITIKNGEVAAKGGLRGAGIGGGDAGDGGTIKIEGGTVTASSIDGGAGIGGGGTVGNGGDITISGGSVVANGGEHGAGIGGGYDGSGETTNISGGTVQATGGSQGAGIGGGDAGNGGNITISGGTVTAIGGNDGAGIGGGFEGNGNIAISGGTVYAERGNTSTGEDIGSGKDAALASVAEISGMAAVFLRYDSIVTPTLPDGHEHKTPGDADNPLLFVDNSVYGIDVDAYWTDTAGGYSRLSTLSYDANGGSGSAADGIYHIGVNVIVHDGSGFTRDGFDFNGWNSSADGSGTDYPPGVGIGMSGAGTILYAQWSEISVTGVTLDKENITMNVGDTVTLTATVEPADAIDPSVSWSSSDIGIVTVDAAGKLTAVSAGSATVMATAGGQSATCEVTVKEQWSEIPVTGVTLDKENITMNMGDTVNLTATVEPADATDPFVSWSSSDIGIVTVDAAGKLTAVSAGSATVTATAGGKSATCEVTVTEQISNPQTGRSNRNQWAFVGMIVLVLAVARVAIGWSKKHRIE